MGRRISLEGVNIILSNCLAFSGTVPIFGSIFTAVLLFLALSRFLYGSLCISLSPVA